MPLTQQRVREIFDNLTSVETAPRFWSHVAEDVHWTIFGVTPISGVVCPRSPLLHFPNL